ncbi:Gfo/Idh/MocA family oxidoreductase [Candidatus Bipolaricaulota bacterium]|nr:Gfo/Idh/MocA family oxidoreductase [Candidatus Bipolaricaulota bacterium]
MTINFGIVGPGNIADRSLAPAINEVEGARLWSVTSRSIKRAKKFAAKHSAEAPDPALDDYEEMLKDPDLDAVIISTPDRLHRENGIKAARAGKHVLMEKPMVAKSEGGEELIEYCRSNGVKLGVAYHLRWHRGHRKLIRKVHDGVLGELQHLRIQWTFMAEDDSNWRAHDEVGRWWGLAGVGTHGLDLIRWAALPPCGEVEEIDSTITNNYWNSPHDETAMVNLRFKSGATAELTTSVLFESEPEFKIYGRKGSAIALDTLGPHGGGSITLNKEDLNFTQKNPYEGEIRDFIESINQDRNPEVPGEEGLRNVEILETAAPDTKPNY